MTEIHEMTSDQYRIDVIDNQTGRFGLAHYPGRYREFREDIRDIVDWRATAVLSLLTQAELVNLGVAELGYAIEGAGLQWLHFPIEDFSVPDLDDWLTARKRVHDILENTGALLIHCRAGLGRTGMIAARLMVERGASPTLATSIVRHHRPGAIETDEQMAFIYR